MVVVFVLIGDEEGGRFCKGRETRKTPVVMVREKGKRERWRKEGRREGYVSIYDPPLISLPLSLLSPSFLSAT